MHPTCLTKTTLHAQNTKRWYNYKPRGKRLHHIVVLPSWTTNQEESPSSILLATYLDAKNYAQVSAIFKWKSYMSKERRKKNTSGRKIKSGKFIQVQITCNLAPTLSLFLVANIKGTVGKKLISFEPWPVVMHYEIYKNQKQPKTMLHSCSLSPTHSRTWRCNCINHETHFHKWAK